MWYIIKAIVLLIRIIIAIGTAVWSPAIPTSGVAIPPPKKGNIPRKADALPAILPLRCIPKEKLVVFTIPTLETTIKSANNNTHIGKVKKTVITSSMLPVKEVETAHLDRKRVV